MELLRTEHLCKVYGTGENQVHALRDVSFSVEKGEFVAIIGQSGSGKSTLIQHLNGLIKASAGELYYNGENIYSQGYDMKQLRSKVGLVFQYPEHQLFEVDVLTDVCFGPKNQGLSREEAEARAKKALEQVGLIAAVERGGAKFWELVPTAGKKNLADAPILKCLEE